MQDGENNIMYESEDDRLIAELQNCVEQQTKRIKQLNDACIEAKMLLETDPRYPGFKGCDCGRCTMCKINTALR